MKHRDFLLSNYTFVVELMDRADKDDGVISIHNHTLFESSIPKNEEQDGNQEYPDTFVLLARLNVVDASNMREDEQSGLFESAIMTL